MAKADPDSVPLQGWIKGPDEAHATERLQVYANMYFARIYNCLRDDYPYVEEVLGESSFYNVCVNYLLRYPSERASLFYIGRHLPAFLDEYVVPDAPPWLSDLARLERALTDTFLGDDCTPLTLETLQSIPPEQWGMLCFQPIPALQVLQLDYPADRAMKALQKKEEITGMEAEPSTVVAWREDMTTHFIRLPEGNARALDALLEGAPFGEICTLFLPEDVDLEGEDELDPAVIQEAVGQAHQALHLWLSNQMLASFSTFAPPE